MRQRNRVPLHKCATHRRLAPHLSSDPMRNVSSVCFATLVFAAHAALFTACNNDDLGTSDDTVDSRADDDLLDDDAPTGAEDVDEETTAPASDAQKLKTDTAPPEDARDDLDAALPDDTNTPDPGPALTVVATGLAAPWDLAFYPGERVFLTLRDEGHVLELHEDDSTTILREFDVNASGEGGLMGIAVGPPEADAPWVYVYFTTNTDNRIVRFRADGGEVEEILTGIPRANIHNGGRIAFGPDGMLYAGTGDAADTALSQEADSLAGKILRMTPEGATPEDNPFPDSLVFSLGHRNVQGFDWDGEGRMYASEFGPQRHDEVNLIEPGANYGWPAVTGFAGDERFVDPVAVEEPPEASWSGLAVLNGGAIPEWEGHVFAAGLRGQRLWRYEPGPDGTFVASEAHLVGEFGRLRHVVQAPDGTIWVVTNNRDGRGRPSDDDDRILRIAAPVP